MSSAMDDLFGPQQHRPEHPDWWRISGVLLQNGGAMEAARTKDEKEAAWQRMTTNVVDIASLVYAGTQRTIFAFGLPALEAMSMMDRAKIASLWMEGFVTGAMFQERGGKQ